MKTTKSDRQPTKRAKAAGKLGRKALHCGLATKNGSEQEFVERQ